MCNRYRSRLAIEAMLGLFADHGLKVATPEGAPNLPPDGDVSITDRAPIVRLGEAGAPELVSRRWSWPGPGGRPVYNFRSDGRRFTAGRCLVPCDAFYEFTEPEPPAPKRGRKTRWAFSLAGEPLLCIAGIWRASDAGEAWSMLTVEPGPDVMPIHDRQIVIVPPAAWRGWLDGSATESTVLRPSPAGTLTVEGA